MKIISKQDMIALKDARGVLEAIEGDNLDEVDALIAGCKVGKVDSVTGLPCVVDPGQFLYDQVRLFCELHEDDEDGPRAMKDWEKALRQIAPDLKPGL